MTNLRVGYDVRPALFNYAGIGRYVRELAVALTQLPPEEGPQLELFSNAWRPGGSLPPGLTASRFRHRRSLTPFLAPQGTDLFHWTDYDYPKVRNVPAVMTLHDASFVMDPKFHGWDSARLLGRVRSAVNHADKVIVPSEPARHDAELLGAHDEQIVVVPHGVAPYFRPAAQALPNSGYLLTVGTLEPRKNYLRLLLALEQAWARDAAPDWMLVARRGWDYEEFLLRLEASRYRHRVRWVESLPDAELLRAYQGALAFLFPSMHEGFGLAVLEAMACGVAPVVSVKTAASWLAGPSAMLVDPKDVDSITEGIERIVSSHPWRRQAAAVALQRAREFSWQRCARETAAVYRSAITSFAKHAERAAASAN